MPSLAIYGDSGMGKTMLMQKFCEIWRDNLSEGRATIWMRFFGRGDEMIVAERQ
ncbi:MAG TPA: NACHT domain-containing protein [Roseiarcus sp.]|nr:NACHT domain-containing protein [Roseiarcus sp.]